MQGRYSAEDLIALFKQDVATAHARLVGKARDHLSLRDYQEKAIRKVKTAPMKGENDS